MVNAVTFIPQRINNSKSTDSNTTSAPNTAKVPASITRNRYIDIFLFILLSLNNLFL